MKLMVIPVGRSLVFSPAKPIEPVAEGAVPENKHLRRHEPRRGEGDKPIEPVAKWRSRKSIDAAKRKPMARVDYEDVEDLETEWKPH